MLYLQHGIQFRQKLNMFETMRLELNPKGVGSQMDDWATPTFTV
jgi:hypothetical protein